MLELVRGRPLDQMIDGGSALPPLDDVARWADQMCRALATAHAAGVVHRDMKPANVLVTAGDREAGEESEVKVLDFGIARLLDGSGPTALTATGTLVGTPAYMSPEQAHGDMPVDHRTDLYSLGCVLYELVTGRPPFDAAAPWHVLLRRHMDEPPVPPSRVRPELPGDWDELILALLEKDPARRPRTAADVRRRLGALGAAAPGARTADSRQPAGPRRNPASDRPAATAGAVAASAAPPPPGAVRPGVADAEAGTRATPAPSRPRPVHPPTRVDTPRPTPAHETPEPPEPPRTPSWLGREAASPAVPPQPARTRASTSRPARPRVGLADTLSAAAIVLVLTIFLLPWWAAFGLTAAAGIVAYLRDRGPSDRHRGLHR
ncbi:serine/threonine-protein kinase [Streptomyces ipomoeae]|uniref:serine/threonine-protein kinase n=2 Tax=Streptomyces ipomoeae TaxID=103232 RepID=UPI0029B05C6B|nr:serine/threonine-protein kinase [Streptomyces ipomoeae]MDX2875882.1 serine/threonine-protein kinase [Streptomyces ipomoeae]